MTHSAIVRTEAGLRVHRFPTPADAARVAQAREVSGEVILAEPPNPRDLRRLAFWQTRRSMSARGTV